MKCKVCKKDLEGGQLVRMEHREQVFYHDDCLFILNIDTKREFKTHGTAMIWSDFKG